MKNQALFSSKDRSKKLKCCLLQFLFSALRVNGEIYIIIPKLSLLPLLIWSTGICSQVTLNLFKEKLQFPSATLCTV